jgi:hypothetical protein
MLRNMLPGEGRGPVPEASRRAPAFAGEQVRSQPRRDPLRT